MDYRFEISSPESSDFRCEIAIGGEQTFQQFHDKIVESLGYDRSQMASFYTINRAGDRVQEIALMDMSEEGRETTPLVMDVTCINEIVKPGCMELEYVYDFFNNHYLKVEFAGEYKGEKGHDLPLCLYVEGEPPVQSSIEGAMEDWDVVDDDFSDDYDDSFMQEFEGGGSFDDDDDDYDSGSRRGRRRSSYDDDDEFRRDPRFESLDDYIDKL